MLSRVRENNIKAKEQKNSILGEWKKSKNSVIGKSNSKKHKEDGNFDTINPSSPSIKNLLNQSSFKLVVAVVFVAYLVSAGSEVAMFLFMNYLTFRYRPKSIEIDNISGHQSYFSHEEEAAYTTKTNVIIIIIIIAVGYVFLPISLFLIRKRICQRIANYFHEIVVSHFVSYIPNSINYNHIYDYL